MSICNLSLPCRRSFRSPRNLSSPTKKVRQLLYTSNFTCAESNVQIILNYFKLCFTHNSTFPCKCHARFGRSKMAESDVMCSSCYFASTAQPGTKNDDIWARWPAKPPCHLFSFTNAYKSRLRLRKTKCTKAGHENP